MEELPPNKALQSTPNPLLRGLGAPELSRWAEQ